MTLKTFITNNKLVIASCKQINQNPNNPNWRDATHWEIVIRYGERIPYNKDRKDVAFKKDTYINFINDEQMVTYFSMGSGHNGKKPNLDEILDSLASDSNSVDSESMDSWIENMGYSTEGMKEIRKAEHLYKVCQAQAEQLKKFLHIHAYEDLLWKVDRL